MLWNCRWHLWWWCDCHSHLHLLLEFHRGMSKWNLSSQQANINLIEATNWLKRADEKLNGWFVDDWKILNAIDSWIEFGFLVSTTKVKQHELKSYSKQFLASNQVVPFLDNLICLFKQLWCVVHVYDHLSHAHSEHPISKTTSGCKQRTKIEAQNNWLIGHCALINLRAYKQVEGFPERSRYKRSCLSRKWHEKQM